MPAATISPVALSFTRRAKPSACISVIGIDRVLGLPSHSIELRMVETRFSTFIASINGSASKGMLSYSTKIILYGAKCACFICFSGNSISTFWPFIANFNIEGFWIF